MSMLETCASSSSIPMHPAVSSSSESSKTMITSSQALFMGRRAGLLKKRGARDDGRGKLSRMSDMHIDIVFQVFGHLGPGDLLNMARTTKGLRGLLMGRSVQWLWIQSFVNMPELPPKPEDLTEPLYADLLFGRTCHFCSCAVPFKEEPIWRWYLRSCKDCLLVNTLDREFYPQNAFLLPSFQTRYLSEYFVEIKGGNGKFTSLIRDIEDFGREYLESKDDSSALRELLDRREKYVQSRVLFATSVSAWFAAQLAKKNKEIEDAIIQRREAIFERLRSAGWDHELTHCTVSLGQHPLVKQSKTLTDRGWLNIRPELEKFLENFRASRLVDERTTCIKRRTETLGKLVQRHIQTRPVTEIFPLPADICHMDEFRSIIFDTPQAEQVSEKSFEIPMARIQELSQKWLLRNRLLLLDLIPSTGTTENAGLSPLDLATTFFRCRWCKDPITYPRILRHDCLMSVRKAIDDGSEFFVACKHLGALPWNFGHNQVSFDVDAFAATKAIIVACGRDPRGITASEMDDLDYRVECLRCVHDKRGHLVMSWRIGVLHDIDEHFDEPKGPEPHWRIINDKDALAKVKQKEATFSKDDSQPTRLRCIWCKEDLNALKVQSTPWGIRCRHNNLKKTSPKNFYPCIDVSMNKPPYPVRVRFQ